MKGFVNNISLVLLGLLIWSIMDVSGVAVAATPEASASASVSDSTTIQQPDKSGFKIQPQLVIAYYPSLRPTLPAYTSIALYAKFAFNDRQSLALWLPNQLDHEVMVGESPFKLADLYAWYTQTLISDFYGFKISPRLGVTFPTSMSSQSKDIYSKPRLSFLIDRPLIGDVLSLHLRPYIRYYWKRFKQDANGNPLPKWELGNYIVLTLKPLEKLSVVGKFVGYVAWKEKSQFAAQSAPPSITYAIELSASYQFIDQVSLDLGYEQVDAFTKQGFTDLNFYDPATSRFYLGLTLSI